MLNAVTPDIAKTEVVFFPKSHQQRLNKQLQEVKINVNKKKILFNKKAMQYLGVWLDSHLNFILLDNEKLKRAQTAKNQVKELTKTDSLVFWSVLWI